MSHSLCLLLLLASSAFAAQHAVLVAGSQGFSNYRHQADVCHAYQTLVSSGMDAANIIVMMMDDIANNSQNPFPGQLFNKPDGQDVYAGVQIDYRGHDVTPKNFLAVLTGDSQTTGGKRVLETTADDEVFIFFSDHGAPGLIAFPSEYLYAKDLNNAINTMHSKKMFKNLLFYLEACESGSMFDQILQSDIGVYAVTAANPHQSSWATYCYPHDTVNGMHINSCLGDEFSVNWMEDSDKHIQSLSQDTYQVGQQYDTVKGETTESQVMEYGEQDLKTLPVGEFQGEKQASFVEKFLLRAAPQKQYGMNSAQSARVSSRDAHLHHLYSKYSQTGYHSHALELQKELSHRMTMDLVFDHFNSKLGLTEEDDGSSVHEIHDCLEASINNFEHRCGKLSDYSLKHVRQFVKACNKGIPYDFIFHTIQALNC